MGTSKIRASRFASLMVSSGSSRKSFETMGMERSRSVRTAL